MDTESAINIITSNNKIKVIYEGTPVWIQGINGSIAKVKFLESNTEGEVPVHDLVKVD